MRVYEQIESRQNLEMSTNLGRTWRLQADSAREIALAFEHAALDLAHLKFRGRKLRPGPLLNALVLAWCDLPPSERERFAVTAIARLDSVLSSGEGQSVGASEGVRVEVPPLNAHVPAPAASSPRIARKRSGRTGG
jgi:hypothetical protein